MRRYRRHRASGREHAVDEHFGTHGLEAEPLSQEPDDDITVRPFAEEDAYQDELLGRLLAKIDLDTTAVFVLSDHGFKSGERRIRSEQTVDINTAHLDHEPEGIFLAAGPGIRRGARVEGASVLDLTPTLLHYLGLPVAKDMDGKVLTEIFEPGFSGKHPIQYVVSYESEAPEAPGTEEAESYGEAELAENLAGLEALGYVQKGQGSAPGAANDPDAAGEDDEEKHDV